MRTASIAICCAALALLTDCSKSSTTQASFESSSDSSSSPFESSSKSSSDDEDGEETAFQRDVRNYTKAFARAKGDVTSFQREVSSIAEEYGISDWERVDDTYVAIGRGLAESGIAERDAHRLAAELSDSAEHLALVASSYAARREP